MDPQTELNLLEAAYQNFASTGVASYRIGDREVTYVNFKEFLTRLDQVRAMVSRQGNGMFQAARNRTPE